MKPFRFPLQVLQTLREQKEQSAQLAYAEAVRARELARERLLAAVGQLEDAWAHRRELTLRGASADMLASVPTLVKAYRHPRSESWVAYAISTFGFGISFLSVQTYNLENATFVAYVFILNGVLAVLASRRRKGEPVASLTR